MPTTKHEVYPSNDLAAAVESYANEHDIPLSAAWKELARYGLQSQDIANGVDSL